MVNNTTTPHPQRHPLPPYTHILDHLCQRGGTLNSILVGGLDPMLSDVPQPLLERAAAAAKTDEDYVFYALSYFYREVLALLHSSFIAVKPQSAFFEQYGIGGLRALSDVIAVAHEYGLPVILDAKRGDIGSTAEADARAYLSPKNSVSGGPNIFAADALTINPYLGLDSLQPFVAMAREFGTALFVLVKTSNPGSKDLQDLHLASTPEAPDSPTTSVSEHIATWVAALGRDCIGASGFSLIGAVIGATFPADLAKYRALLPHTPFLIPGVGSQGGLVNDILPALNQLGQGGLVSVSRGLFSLDTQNNPQTKNASQDMEAWRQLLTTRAAKYLTDLQSILPSSEMQ